jgi:hypothetical protein
MSHGHTVSKMVIDEAQGMPPGCDNDGCDNFLSSDEELERGTCDECEEPTECSWCGEPTDPQGFVDGTVCYRCREPEEEEPGNDED